MLYYVIFLSIAEVAVTWVRKNRSTDVFVWENYKQNKEPPMVDHVIKTSLFSVLRISSIMAMQDPRELETALFVRFLIIYQDVLVFEDNLHKVGRFSLN